ncbi:hypothetical protein AVEN_75390-1 [Araneus ventricosus]|uniref:Uncharacterized protein n=1 Tax=Araneus ventricosus TaxID=182803 RepID=A0A4Y2HWR5_ARAVE|nr:hypothetical protein AVEN_75390-1 [Araneus ventricosus]
MSSNALVKERKSSNQEFIYHHPRCKFTKRRQNDLGEFQTCNASKSITTEEIHGKTNLLIPSSDFPAFHDSDNLVENRVSWMGGRRRKSSRLLHPKSPAVSPANHKTSSLLDQDYHASYLPVLHTAWLMCSTLPDGNLLLCIWDATIDQI